MLSTSSASAAFHAARSWSTLVACGWSWTPTLNLAMAPTLPSAGKCAERSGEVLIVQFDAAPAVAEHERSLAAQEPAQRFADELGAPTGGEAARAVLQHLRELGAGREQS